MIDETYFDQFKGKTIDHIDNRTDMYNREYQEITIHFTDGTNIEISGGGGYYAYLNIN